MDWPKLLGRLAVSLGETPVSSKTVIDDLVAATDGGQMGSASGRFYAWVIGGALPAALAADWLASTWDVNACTIAAGPRPRSRGGRRRVGQGRARLAAGRLVRVHHRVPNGAY